MKFLALDLGTSSVRGVVLTERCRPIPGAFARRETVLAIGSDGSATLDGQTYLTQLAECLDDLALTGHLAGVEVVAVSSQWHAIVPVDVTGKAIGPVLTWLDTRPTPVPGTHGPADPLAFHERTGCWWHRLYWTVRVPWLRSQSGVAPAGFTGLSAYLYGQLLGDGPMSISHASGAGMLDLRTATWDEEAIELAGMRRSELPRLAPAGWTGRLRSEFARRWPALRYARWMIPTGDGAASNVGSHCADTSRAAVTVGTSAAVRLTQEVPAGEPLPPLPHNLWRYRMDYDRIVTGVAYSAGGNLFSWSKRELRLPDQEDLDAALALLEPGTGVQADPRLGGDRPPGVAPAGSGELRGLSFGTTSVEILAALMDGLCRQVARDLKDIESTVDRTVDVVLGGRAMAGSQWWRRAFAVALAPRLVYYVSHPEVGALGAALLAAGLPGECASFERVYPRGEPMPSPDQRPNEQPKIAS